MKINLHARGLVAAIIFLFPLASHAQFDPNHIYKIVNRKSGLALEIGGDDRYSEGHIANLWAYWGGAHQQWRITVTGVSPIGATLYKIENRNSRQALQILGKTNTTSNTYPYAVKQEPSQGWYSNGDGQQWSMKTRGVYKTLVNFRSGLSLSYEPDYPSLIAPSNPSSGATTLPPQLAQNFDFGDDVSDWDIVDVSAEQEPGVYQIINVNSGKALSAVAPQRDQNNNRVTQWTNWYLAGQQWIFSDYNSDGYLAIMNRVDHRVLEIGGGGDLTQPGRTADIWDSWGGQNQQWALLDINDSHVLTVAEASDGRICKIYNRVSGKVLEIADSRMTDDAIAGQWYDYNLPTQQWRIQYVSQNRGAVLANTSQSTTASYGVTLYPNPAHNVLFINLTGIEKPVAVKVIDALGRSTSAQYQTNGQIDISSLSSGLYVVSFSDGRHEYRHKFVKE